MFVHGVDFSGAADAGRRIWISSGVIHDGRLRIMETRPASELPGGSVVRDTALRALRSFIQSASGAIGLDFPFGLPRMVTAKPTWTEFILDFSSRYPTAAAFRAECRQLSARELRRTTDAEAHAPWAAWNWRLYRQTYFGIGEVIAPLVRERRVRVLPMQEADHATPLLLEICPASTLRRLGIAGLRYKGGADADQRRARKAIVSRLGEATRMAIDPIARRRAIEDPGGDALDSLVAAVAVHRAIAGERVQPTDAVCQIEGFIYV